MNIEGSGDGANGLALENELACEFGLIGSHFLWASKGHKQARLRSLRDLDGAAMLLHAMGLFVMATGVICS